MKKCCVKLIETLDYISVAVYCEQSERYEDKGFLEFLKTTLFHYKSGKIFIISDNTKIHHTKLLKPFLEEVKERTELNVPITI